MQYRHFLLVAMALGLSLLASGCSGGSRKPAYKVRSQVLLEGRPVPQAIVTFHPVNGTTATEPTPSARTDEQGYFKPVNGSQVKTKTPGVYVAGDCADHVYRQAITAAGMGCQAAIETERWLAEHGD